MLKVSQTQVLVVFLYCQVKVTRDNVIDETGTRVPMISTDVLMGIDEVTCHCHFTHIFIYHMTLRLRVK